MVTESVDKDVTKGKAPVKTEGTNGSVVAVPVPPERISKIITCVDGSSVSNGVIPFAESLANALLANMQLITVLEPETENEAPFDPVEWALRRKEAELFLESLVAEYKLNPLHTSYSVLEGKSAAAIGSCLGQSQREITVFCRKDEQESGHIGTTSRSVLERCSGSIFLVPASAVTNNRVGFKRIMVPLDGSPRAESVLPTVSTLAKACDATVLVVHAAPRSFVSELTPGDPASRKLKDALEKHNQSAAIQYVDRVSRRLRESKVNVETHVLPSGDTRRRLINEINTNAVDLVVLSSHGLSGYCDVPFGDVASHIMARSPVPALMLRDLTLSSAASVMDRLSDSAGRAPEGAD